MKRYKLLKDLPFAKAGEILELWSDGIMAFADAPSLPRFNKEDVKMFSLWFEEIKSFEVSDEFKMGFWTIMYGEDGFYAWHLSSDKFEENYEKMLKYHMEIGLAFETRKEAEKHLKWLKARVVLLEDTKGFKASTFNNFRGYQVYYSASWCKFMVSSPCLVANIYGGISFETEEDAHASIKNHTKEWKIYLGVE